MYQLFKLLCFRLFRLQIETKSLLHQCLPYTLYDKPDALGGRSVYQSPVPILRNIVKLPY